jgi:type 1 glutamine amidotransferase
MRAVLRAAALAALFAPAAAPADEPKPDKKIRVILIDGQNNHNWRATTPVLKKALEDTGRFTVDVSSFQKKDEKAQWPDAVPFPPDLSKYDVLVSNYNGSPWPDTFNKALESALKEGHIDLVIVHAANNSFPGWPEYNEMIGMGWRAATFGDRLVVDEQGKEKRVEKGKGPGSSHGPRHEFKVTIRDGEHPVTKGMPPEWMHAIDELYHGMRGPVHHVHLLATAFSDKGKGGTGEHEPMIWTVDYGKGRVFHTPMGHDVDAIRCVGFQAVLQRGTEWAATGKVTIPLPKDFPAADKSLSVPK